MRREADAFETFFRKHYRWVTGEAARVVGSLDAEDVAQEVLYRVSIAMDRGDFDPGAGERTYLRTATHRVADRHRRWRFRQTPLFTAEDEDMDPMDETQHGDPARALAARRQWDEIEDLLDTMSRERRQIWVMAEMEEMRLAEIAEILAISPNTVSTRLQAARADFDGAVARKRVAEERKERRAGTPLVLPLDTAALTRVAKSLPMPYVSPAAGERIWHRIRERRDAKRKTNPIAPRLRSAGRDIRVFGAGTAVGALLTLGALFAARFWVDSRVPEPPPAEVRPERIAVAPVIVAPLDSADEITEPAPSEPASSAVPLPSCDDAQLPEVRLIERIRAALAPPAPNAALALRLIATHDQRHADSPRYRTVIEQLHERALRVIREQRNGM